jgi:hypothetical protein
MKNKKGVGRKKIISNWRRRRGEERRWNDGNKIEMR